MVRYTFTTIPNFAHFQECYLAPTKDKNIIIVTKKRICLNMRPDSAVGGAGGLVRPCCQNCRR